MNHNSQTAISRAQEFLLARQRREGYFYSELHMDLGLEADTIFKLRFLGIEDKPLERKLLNFILEREIEDGGWSIYPGGPPELNTTIKCYIALKLSGCGQDEPMMRRRREIILGLGGIERANSYNKFYLAMFGLGSWSAAPAIPPEIILFPSWFSFNIYELSAWSRKIIIPLSVVWAYKPVRPLEDKFNVDELYKNGRRPRTIGLSFERPFFSWRNFFLLFDCAVKFLYKLRIRPFRKFAITKAHRWIAERIEKGSGLGAIFPSMVNAIFALSCLGYKNDHSILVSCLDELKKLLLIRADMAEMQPCLSPVWDSAQTVYALALSGLARDHEALVRAGRWLLSKEVTICGDWNVKARDASPGGWYFEFENEFYPDIDDTAAVLLALSFIDMKGDEDKKKSAFQRGLSWLLAMQSRDGGFSSFDKDNDNHFLTHIPFADHNAMLDPTCPDITGRICELLGRLNLPSEEPHLKEALSFLERHQERDGSWYGRWGVNYLYGTYLASRGISLSSKKNRENLRKASQWICDMQNRDGGWGETPASYDDPSLKGKGPSAPSQTAWALLGLFACRSLGEYPRDAIERGIDYLIRNQKEDGSWQEREFTGTGFPSVCYLRYELYSTYFPLLALAEYERFAARREPSSGRKKEVLVKDEI